MLAEYDGDSESEYDEYVEDGGSDNTQIGETDAGLSAEYAEEYPEESEYADEGAAAVEQPVPYNLEDPILDDVQIPCQFLTCDFEGGSFQIPLQYQYCHCISLSFVAFENHKAVFSYFMIFDSFKLTYRN